MLSIVNSGKFQNTGSATLACNLGWTPAPGNTIVVIAGDRCTAGAAANHVITDNQGNTYSRLTQAFDGAVKVDGSIHSAPSVSSNGSWTITLTTNQVTLAALTVFVVEIAGADTYAPLNSQVTAHALSTAPSPGAETNANASSIVFAVAFNNDTGGAATFTDPGGSWTSLQSNTNGSTGVVGSVVYQIVTTSAALTATWTSGNQIWVAISFAVQAQVAKYLALDQIFNGVLNEATGSLQHSETPTPTGGLTPYHLVSAATANATSVKASAGKIYSFSAFNVNSSPRYLKFFDKAAAPTLGTDTPVQTFLIPPTNSGLAPGIPGGIQFNNGIAFAITGAMADNDTTAVSAADVVVNIGYK